MWRAEVDKVSHRPYSTGFYYGGPGQHTAHARYLRDWQVVGVVTSCAPDGAALCELRNKFAEGDELELVGPGVRPVSFRVEGLTDGDGLPIPEARKPQMPFRLSLPITVFYFRTNVTIGNPIWILYIHAKISGTPLLLRISEFTIIAFKILLFLKIFTARI